MPFISIDDRLYAAVSRRAEELGFLSIDGYVADLLRQDLVELPEDLNSLFTPERLAMIDEALAEIDAGKGIPAEEVRKQLRRKLDL